MSTTDDKLLGEGDPLNPPCEGKCPIDDLPDELLSYIFQVGVEIEEDEEDEDSDSSDEDEWEDVDDDPGSDKASDAEVSDDRPSISSSDLSLSRVVSTASDQDPSGEDEVSQKSVPFQVLVSHVCRRWRSISLDTHRFWATLRFRRRPKLSQAKEYLARSDGLPLTIELDCTVDSDDELPDEFEIEELSDTSEDGLSLEELERVLDLLEPAVSHWGTFIFHASSYDFVQALMSRLHKLPAAPCLESFQIHIYESWEDSVLIPVECKTPYLPFQGQAPNLKEAVFWGINIDWDGALSKFLRGLRDLELSYLTTDVQPTYAAFAEIIRNSPELRTLTLSLAGPVLPDGVAFDSDEGWGSVPLTIPSLTELVLQFHEPKYAAALVQHLDLPNVTQLVLNFDEEDYSGFVQTLARPTKGRDKSLLRQITHLKISGLPCDITSVEILLSQLISLKSLNLKLYGSEEEVIYEKLVNPWALRIGPASSSTTLSPPVEIPKVFCPKLEEITTTGLNGERVKALIIARQEAQVPLKKVHMAISEDYAVMTDDELWMKENVEELGFYDPSDSEEEYE